MWHLIWVCTVCLRPFNGIPGKNELINIIFHLLFQGAVIGEIDKMLAFKNNESYFPFYEPFKDKLDSMTSIPASNK